LPEELSLRDVLLVLQKRWGWVAILTLLGTFVAYFVTVYYFTPVYAASTQLIVNPKQNENSPLTYSDLQISLNLIETYKEVLKSPRILNKVIQDTGYPLGVGELLKHMRVNTVKQSQVLSLTVEDSSPERAATLANATARVFQQEIPKILRVDNVEILAEAHPSTIPIRPNVPLNVFIGGALGFFGGIVVIFLLEALDTTFREEKQIEEVLGLPVLGEIGIVSSELGKKRSRVSSSIHSPPESRGRGSLPSSSSSNSPSAEERRVEV